MRIGTQIGANAMRCGDGRYQMLRRVGFDCVDLSFMNPTIAPYTLAEEEFDAYLRHETQLPDEAGIEIFQMHGPWFSLSPQADTPEKRVQHMAEMTRSLQIAKGLSCKNRVIHPLMPFGTHPEVGHEQETWGINLAFLSELLQYARELDITICLENMPFSKFSISKPAEILRFVREINDDHFKICLDTGHVAKFSGASPADALRQLGGEVRVLHIHDN